MLAEREESGRESNGNIKKERATTVGSKADRVMDVKTCVLEIC